MRYGSVWYLIVAGWIAEYTASRRRAGQSHHSPCRSASVQSDPGAVTRISAIGLEPELVRHEPSIEEFESPFLAQNPEALAYLTRYETWWVNPDSQCDDDKQLLVLLDQCNKLIERIHRHAALEGTSIRLTFVLKRLQQHLDRFAILLALLDSLREIAPPGQLCNRYRAVQNAGTCTVSARMIYTNTGGRVSDCWLCASLKNASRAGEHYITETVLNTLPCGVLHWVQVSSWLLWPCRSFIVGKYDLAPLTLCTIGRPQLRAGFVLIHVLHCTLATKQPAMTAAAIAASIDEHSGKQPDLENLTSLIASLVRSQFGRNSR